MKPRFYIRSRTIAIIVLLLGPISLMAYDVLSDNLSGPRYVVPLPGGYVLNTAANSFILPSESATYGSFQIIKPPQDWESDPDPLLLSLFYPGSTDSVDCVRNVKQIAVSSCLVYGKTTSKFFLLRTVARKLVFFRSEAELSAALPSDAMQSNRLKSPNDLAVGLNKRVKHPWAFAEMNGLFGLSDGAWSGIMVDTGLLVVFMEGLLITRGKTAASLLFNKVGLLFFGVVCGFITACIAYGWLLQSGPMCLVGILLLSPLFGVWAACSYELPSLLVTIARLCHNRSGEAGCRSG
jgi:hypothetical protein